MSEPERKRPYRSQRRREQAEETRRRILDAAARVFVERGFAGATIEAVAREASVAAPTVYAVFASKRRLLAEAVRSALRGGASAPSVLESPQARAVREAKTQAEQLRLFARDITERLERVGALMDVVAAAAAQEPEAADLRQRLQAARLANHRAMIGWLQEKGPLRGGLTQLAAAELSWTLASPEVHRLLRRERGWSKARFSRWLEAMLVRLLLEEGEPPPSAAD